MTAAIYAFVARWGVWLLGGAFALGIALTIHVIKEAGRDEARADHARAAECAEALTERIIREIDDGYDEIDGGSRAERLERLRDAAARAVTAGGCR